MKLSVDSAYIADNASAAERAAPIFSVLHFDDKFLDVTMEYQEKSNWCWAAIASSLGSFYKSERLSQSQVAERVLGTASGDAANATALLGEALRHVGCRGDWSPGRPSLRMIAREIGAERPMGVCLQWPTGASHYVVITGCAERTREIAIWDPLHGPSIQSYDGFPRAYHFAGVVWRGAYLTGRLEEAPRESGGLE